MSIAAFVAGVDRLLTRAHDLYPAADVGGKLRASGDGGSVPASPEGASGPRGGVTRVAGAYQQARTAAGGLDEELTQAAAQGGAIGEQGRVASGVIRAQARAVGAQAATLGRAPAGAQLIMAAMNQHLSAMQGQLQSTKTQYQGVSATLRQVAAGYQTLSIDASMSHDDVSGSGDDGIGPQPPTGIVWCLPRPSGGFTCRELLPDGTIAIFSSPTDISGHWPD
ncbi:hypothetical protein [Mycobacterium intracellulare]|uniref:hypothetical protein n=1 Tax=Mycobacterium intracellulare TaxID=1767 RepID=UPI000C7C99F9|nr:hypothetical protein [Mycobacterium intracellulare]